MPKTVIVEADIDRVLDNPHRDFTNYPIDETQIARLMASLTEFGEGETADESGLWHAMPARPAKEAGAYEICFGHHRKVAAKRLGRKKIRLEVGPHDDDEMIMMLATENGTQRVNNSAASLDSVAAITRRLAYLLLRADSLDDLSRIHERSVIEKLFTSQKAFEVARGTLLKGDGVGQSLILKYAPAGSLSNPEVQSSIATLKADGGYQRIIEQVTETVRQERGVEEVERERRNQEERERAAKAARDAQEFAERQAREAEAREARERERQEEAARKTEAAEFARMLAASQNNARRQAEEERKAAAAKHQEQQAAAELARLKVQREQQERDRAADAEERRKIAALQEERREAERKVAEEKDAELLALAAKAALADPLLDSRVVPLFRNHHCLSRFREIVTDPNNRHWFPLDGQLGQAKDICELFEKQNKKPAAENLTANYIGSYLNRFLADNQRAARDDERRARTLSQTFEVELTKAVKGSTWIYGAVAEMVKLLDDGATPPGDFEEKLRSLEMQATDQIARLRAKSGYVRDAKEIAGDVTPLPRRPANSRR